MAKQIVQWKDDYLTGIIKIDEQHKKLIEITNNLYAAISTPGADRKGAFKKAVQDAVSYVKEHLATEEQWMTDHYCPEFKRQKSKHVEFVKEILEHTGRYEKGDTLAPHSFIKFLAKWLQNHIRYEDKKLGDFARKQGIIE